MLNRREFLAQLGAAAAAITVHDARAQSPRAAVAPPLEVERRSLDELHKAALAEDGRLVVYGGGDLPNGAAGLEQAFMKRFPGLRIRILIDRSKYQGVRIDNQLARGRLQCDVVHILASHFYDRWQSDGHLMRYKPLGWDEVFADFRDPEGYVTSVFVFAFASYVNTKLVPLAEAPRDAIDFLAPKLKGKIALTYPHDDDSILYQFDRIISQHGWDYMDRLLEQDVLWVRGSGVNRQLIDSGTRAVSFNTSGPLIASPAAATRWLLPQRDSFLAWAHPASIFKEARNPNAAKLYLSWLLSAERQGSGSAWSVRRDMPVPQGYGPLFAHNTYPIHFRQWLRDRARLEKLRDQLEQLIGPMVGENPTKVNGVFPEDV
jgi:ABC-type Fe3+ transport system substrate-binding protein